MIPVRLTLQGIYSYQETPQTIEFGPLLEAGTFGIFGAVGSGKSSILEAISFVLYGDIERLNRREDRNYNMMNLKSDRLIIDFQFRNHDGDLYRFECEGRRNSKNFRDVPTYRRRASKWEGDEWVPLDHADGEKITGITYQNFKRTVIVPQGHFQDFLGLTPGDRSQMLQELFHLDKYDLAEPTKKLTDQNTEALHKIQGQLLGYELVSEENIALVEKEWLGLKEVLQTISLALQHVARELESSHSLKQLFERKEECETRQSVLKQQEDDIRQTRQRIQLLQEARAQFFHRFSQIDALRRSILQTELKIKDLTQRVEVIGKRSEEIQRQYVELEKAVDSHTRLMEQSREFATAANWSILNEEMSIALKRVQKGQAFIGQLRKEIQEKEHEMSQVEKELQALTASTQDRELLIELKNGFSRKKEVEAHYSKVEVRLRQAQKKMESELMGFCNKYHVPLRGKNQLPDISGLDQRLNDLHQQISNFNRQSNELNIKSELARYVSGLVSGESCPLCGSREHPAPAHFESVQDEIDDITRQIHITEKEIRHLEAARVEWKGLERNLHQYLENQRHNQEELNMLKSNQLEIEDILHVHREKYPDAAKVGIALEESERTLKKLKSREAWLEELRRSVREEMDKLDIYRSKIDEIRQLVERKRGELASVETQLGEVVKAQLGIRTPEEWKAQSNALMEKIGREKDEFRKISMERDRISQEYTQCQTNLESNIAFREREMNQLNELEGILDKTLKSSSFDSYDSVREILRFDLDVPAEQERIARYERDVHVLEVTLAELNNQIGSRIFDGTKHEQLVRQQAEKEVELNRAREQMIYQGKRLDELRKQWKEKQKLEEERDALQIRADNLKVLESLFKGKKFVDYVSTVYLREICEIANRRFRKLTNNHYALILGEDNQFQIRDFLHDGQIRSVKTLSGGQIFQVSLCLALALAESIQNRTRSRQSFFFLDEGFGTLDGDALNMVMDTLKSLRQEGRVIGMISHVESLQQEMDVHLYIVNDPEKGSHVRKSY